MTEKSEAASNDEEISTTENNGSDRNKTSKHWLSRIFNVAAPMAAGLGVGLAIKSCVVASLCTVGAPAMVTAVVASASAGLLTGLLKEGWKYNSEQKEDPTAKFFTKKRLSRLFTSMAIAGVAGSFSFVFADEIKDAAGFVYDKVGGLFGGAALAPLESSVVETPLQEDTGPSESVVLEEAAEIPVIPVQIVESDIYAVEKGDNLWTIVKEHYGLTNDADIQRYTDGVAAGNNLTSGTAASHLALDDQITLMPAEILENHNQLALDWTALDAETKGNLSQNTVSSHVPIKPAVLVVSDVNEAVSFPTEGVEEIQEIEPVVIQALEPVKPILKDVGLIQSLERPESVTSDFNKTQILDTYTEPMGIWEENTEFADNKALDTPTEPMGIWEDKPELAADINQDNNEGAVCSPVIQGADIGFVCAMDHGNLAIIEGDSIIIQPALFSPR